MQEEGRASSRPPLARDTIPYGRDIVAVWSAVLSVALLMVYLGAIDIVNRAAGVEANLTSSLVAGAVASSASVSLIQRMLSPRSHIADDQFCLRYAALVREVRRLIERGEVHGSDPETAEAITRALGLSYVDLRLCDEAGVPGMYSTWGRRSARIVQLELNYAGDTLGTLVVSPGGGRRVLTAEERILLDELAAELAVAAHVLRVTNVLRRSRQNLLKVREEERRRIRRDLHDGLGPALAAVTMRIDAARRLIDVNPAEADALLARLHTETENAVAEVRQLIAELNAPGPLGFELGCALREQASRFEQASGGKLAVRVEAPPDLPRLGAVVKLAAYRIFSEALTNVAKHARASRCTVRLSVDWNVRLEITDDGVGLPTRPTGGMGLASMRDRARELGGECTIEPLWPRGTRVVALLPLERS